MFSYHKNKIIPFILQRRQHIHFVGIVKNPSKWSHKDSKIKKKEDQEKSANIKHLTSP